MQVTLSQPRFLPELIDFLGRASCVAVCTHGATVDVELPYTNDADRAFRELTLYVAAWQGLHPDVRAQLAPGPEKRRDST